MLHVKKSTYWNKMFTFRKIYPAQGGGGGLNYNEKIL